MKLAKLLWEGFPSKRSVCSSSAPKQRGPFVTPVSRHTPSLQTFDNMLPVHEPPPRLARRTVEAALAPPDNAAIPFTARRGIGIHLLLLMVNVLLVAYNSRGAWAPIILSMPKTNAPHELLHLPGIQKTDPAAQTGAAATAAARRRAQGTVCPECPACPGEDPVVGVGDEGEQPPPPVLQEDLTAAYVAMLLVLGGSAVICCGLCWFFGGWKSWFWSMIGNK